MFWRSSAGLGASRAVPNRGATTIDALRQRYPELGESELMSTVQGRMEVTVRAATALASKAVYRKSVASHWRKLSARLRFAFAGRSRDPDGHAG